MKKEIKFYPLNENTVMFSPEPTPSSRLIPDWYRKQPGLVDTGNEVNNGGGGATVKKCMPVFDALTAGYIITAPCDIYLDATDPEKLSYSVPIKLKQFQSDMFATHAFEQYDYYPIDKSIYHKQLFRIFPFWSVGTPKGYSAFYLQPMHRELETQAIPAIVDTDSYVSEGHASFLVKKGFKGVIKQGTPLVQVIPFKRESWIKKIVDVPNSTKFLAKQRYILRSKFVNAYKDMFWFKKEYK
jgi:hypothetical protein